MTYERRPRVPRRAEYANQDASTLMTFLVTFALIMVVAAVLFLGSAVSVPDVPDLGRLPMAGLVGAPTTTAGPPPRRTSTPEPSPTAGPSPTVTPASKKTARIANTDGLGAYIWKQPGKDRITPWADNTPLELLSDERPTADGKTWRNVRDPRGNEGWIPDIYIKVVEE